MFRYKPTKNINVSERERLENEWQMNKFRFKYVSTISTISIICTYMMLAIRLKSILTVINGNAGFVDAEAAAAIGQKCEVIYAEFL